MSGLLLHFGATVLCAHGGQATPSAPMPRVLVSGQPVVTQAAPWLVAGCPNAAAVGPCLTAQWVVAATRVLAGGQPVLLMSSLAVCAPTGTPLAPLAAQTRVVGM